MTWQRRTKCQVEDEEKKEKKEESSAAACHFPEKIEKLFFPASTRAKKEEINTGENGPGEIDGVGCLLAT